jgi:hypothetical protein
MFFSAAGSKLSIEYAWYGAPGLVTATFVQWPNWLDDEKFCTKLYQLGIEHNCGK